MKTTGNKPKFIVLLAALSIATGGCGTAKISRQKSLGTVSANSPAVIYIADFHLDAAEIKSEKGFIPAPPKLPGPPGNMLPPPPGAARDPQKLARELVDQMSDSIVRELGKAGLVARRLRRGEDLPPTGWLVRGVFIQLSQGNQLRRAVIGFGAGKTELQVVVNISDLTNGAPRDFYELNARADSGSAPGAGPLIVFGPAGVAARFVIAGKDLDRNIKQTAARIAGEIANHAEARVKHNMADSTTGENGSPFREQKMSRGASPDDYVAESLFLKMASP